jgi:hypothetical protein
MSKTSEVCNRQLGGTSGSDLDILKLESCEDLLCTSPNTIYASDDPQYAKIIDRGRKIGCDWFQFPDIDIPEVKTHF